MPNGGPRIQKSDRSDAVQLDDVCTPFHTFMVFSESGDHVVSATILAQA
jgi:hypothetical protein